MNANTYDNAAQPIGTARMLFACNAIAARSRTSKDFLMARFSQLACNLFPVFFGPFIVFILIGLASNPFSRNRDRNKLPARAIQLQDLILYGGTVPGPARDIQKVITWPFIPLLI